MKPKPSGPKYRNLFGRGGAIYYQRVVNLTRVRFSCETTDWDEAATVRDVYEQRKGIGRLPAPILAAPRLRDFATRNVDAETERLVRFPAPRERATR